MGLSRNAPNARHGRAAHQVSERAVATARKGCPARASPHAPREVPLEDTQGWALKPEPVQLPARTLIR